MDLLNAEARRKALGKLPPTIRRMNTIPETMNEPTEITKEAFIAIRGDGSAESIIEAELYRQVNFIAKGVYLWQITNYVSAVTQYYIRDINS